MISRLLFGFSLLFFIKAESQNLICNPSFIDLDTCSGYSPYNINEVYCWSSTYFNSNSISPNGSTDYFTTDCANHWHGQIPTNAIGNQSIRILKNYAGLYIYFLSSSFNNEYREGIQNELISGLVADSLYIFQVYISLADTVEISVDRIEVLLSNDRYTYHDFGWDTSVIPDFVMEIPENSNIKEEWIKVTAEFVAKGGEKWISIGNFSSNSTFQYLNVFPNSYLINCSYYYIDDVSLYLKSTPVYVANAGTDRNICLDSSVQIGIPGRDNYYYFWLSEQGDTLGTTAQLTVSPTQTTTYILSQWDFKFDQTWDTVTVFVEPNCPELWLPTWFAPSQSQYWHPQWRDIEYWEITVYNSLGQVVHRYTGSPELHPGWDGYNMATGVYCAVVNARAYNGEQLRVVEKVMLLR